MEKNKNYLSEPPSGFPRSKSSLSAAATPLHLLIPQPRLHKDHGRTFG